MTDFGAHATSDGTTFCVRAPGAEQVTLCLFDKETERQFPMERSEDGAWHARIAENGAGQHYGYRAHGPWAPESGLWFDPAKLLLDPYAQELTHRFQWHPALATYGEDTASLVPRAIVPPADASSIESAHAKTPYFQQGGLIYELNVRGFTMLHPDIPPAMRGTIAALTHPACIAHFQKLGVTAIELMPIIAWIDERHLAKRGLRNAWGYNPVVPMALDPGLCPGGVAEFRQTIAALHAAGIGVILDIVLNHTGESDSEGPILSLRGLDNDAYAHTGDGTLINDTGCGNTLNFANPAVRTLALDTLRHFTRLGVDGFRFDLATILARGPGFDRAAPIFAEIAADPVLSSRIMIAEPWDIGPGGYQLGSFPPHWLEWNDRFRDDVRRFWRGDSIIGILATRLAGSSDIFGEGQCRSVNFLAAHDGFTLADTVAYTQRHNEDNGEDNRDGQAENYSWNHGAEGPTNNPEILTRRRQGILAMLGTLFASTGTIMLTAGDEFGRTQCGNNNAYAQDNTITWLDWENRDVALEDHVARLAMARAMRADWFAQFPEQGEWRALDGSDLSAAQWNDPGVSGFTYRSADSSAPYGITIDLSTHTAILSSA